MSTEDEVLKAKGMPPWIIKPRFILVTHTNDLSWYITSNQQGKMFVQNLNRIVRKIGSLLCLLYKIRCKPVHPLNGARMCQCGLHAVLWSHIGTLMHRLAAEPCNIAELLIPFSLSLWNDHANPVFDGVGLVGSRAGPMFLYWPRLLYPYYSLLLFFPFSYFCL